MLSLLVVVLYFTFGASVVAQSSSASVLCIAGQCLQGFSNTTIGAKLSSPGAPTSLLLLPGQYTGTTNPQLLHNLLTSSSATLTPSPGFNSTSSTSLPLTIDLDPGFVIYASSLYSGQPSFLPLPTSPIVNSSTPLAANSLALSANVWAAVTSGSNKDRIVIWDAVPDISQLPAGASQSLSLLDVQSSACSPPCSGSGVCSVSGTCTCPTGFTGSSCETCAEGFFGPTCQPCPTGCGSCDQGISGSGICLTPVITNAPSTCNCLNGQCGTNGQCTCNPGWTKADNGTDCAKCAPGFFLTSSGDCQVCQIGCSSCTDISGTCTSCKNGFTADANDKSKCNPLPSTIPGTTPGTTQTCPDGSFSTGQQCAVCSPSCGTCSGASSNDCTGCPIGQFLFGGNCVGINANGVCQGTNGMIADNNKKECDTCGAKCTSCSYTNFNAGSTTSQLQCTACLPGFVLSQGKCVASCPAGTFVSPRDNLTCTACSSSCGTCAGSADFCLTCNSGLLSSSGQCVSTCPSNTFSSSGSCIKCHPDCGSCSGSSFNQCTSCNADRPVLTNGRCLPTCSKSQYFDKTTSSCQSCDSSCSSCLGPGAKSCLACSSSTQVLRGGSCIAANCNGATNVIPGLGVCLSELVIAPSTTGTAGPLPTITGLADPTALSTRRPLQWWQILLMALGCAFIFAVVLVLYRRRARKQRAERTRKFAEAKRLDNPQGWRWRLARFGERLFGSGRAGNRLHKERDGILPVAYNHQERERPTSLISYSRDIKLNDMSSSTSPDRSKRETTQTRDDVEKFIDSYDYYSTYARSSRVPSLPVREDRQHRLGTQQRRIERDSLYSEVTGNQRHTPEPRQPLRREPSGASGFSKLTRSSASSSSRARDLTKAKEGVLVDLDDQAPSTPALPLQMTNNSTIPTTEAQKYMMTVRPGLLNAAPTPSASASAQLQPSQAMVGTSTTGGSFSPIPVTLIPNTTMGQGSYWLSPVVPLQPTDVSLGQQQFQPQQPLPTFLQFSHPSEETVVLQPMHTGGSSSKNPFRQGLY